MSLSEYYSCICIGEVSISQKHLMTNVQNLNKNIILKGTKVINVVTKEEPTELKLGLSLTSEEKKRFLHLLNELNDIFCIVLQRYD